MRNTDLRGSSFVGVDLREVALKATMIDLAGSMHFARCHGLRVEPRVGKLVLASRA